MTGGKWNFRAYREEDIPAISSLINASDAADGLPVRANEEDLRLHFSTPGLAPLQQVIVVAGRDEATTKEGVLLGYGRAFPSEDSAGTERVYDLALRVHPEVRYMGLEREIATRLVGLARRYEALPGQRKVERVRLRSYLYEKHIAVREAWRQLGMSEVRQSLTMTRRLDVPIEEPGTVGGVRIRTYKHPEDNGRSLRALNASFADYFDYRPLSIDRWSREMAAPYVRPDLSWLAEMDDGSGEVASLCICWVDRDENALSGRLDGWVEGIGTVPEWRNRGLGTALLLRGLHSLRSAGMEAALADVDAQGPSAAMQLFVSNGFTVRDRMYQYECLLAEITI